MTDRRATVDLGRWMIVVLSTTRDAEGRAAVRRAEREPERQPVPEAYEAPARSGSRT
ncbi:hypothetical protein ABZ926_04220 [Streptomyces litmocidini]|uniref:hypothetical protein n=1 Tax=Streptomyces litmocidini TaxID=67318 RepID=UPI003402732E